MITVYIDGQTPIIDDDAETDHLITPAQLAAVYRLVHLAHKCARLLPYDERCELRAAAEQVGQA